MAIICLILPVISYLLVFINPLFEWTNWAIIGISNIAKVIPTLGVNYLSIILFFVLLTFASKYNMQKGFNKLATVSVCVSILALQLVFV